MSKIYGFKGRKVKLTDVVSGSESFTLVLRVSCGLNAKLHNPFIIFSNKTVHILYVDCLTSLMVRTCIHVFSCCWIVGVSYRTSPKGWMSRAVFEEYLAEDRAISRHPNGKQFNSLWIIVLDMWKQPRRRKSFIQKT